MTKTCNQSDNFNELVCIDIEIKLKREGEKHNTYKGQLREVEDMKTEKLLLREFLLVP